MRKASEGPAEKPAETTAPEARKRTARTGSANCAVLPLSSFGDAGSEIATSTLARWETVCYTVTVTSAGLHGFAIRSGLGDSAFDVLAGGENVCSGVTAGGLVRCRLSPGAHTVQITNYSPTPDEFTFSVLPLFGADPAGCLPRADASLGAAPATGTVAGPMTFLCQPFYGRVHDRILLDFTPGRGDRGEALILDSTGALICPARPEPNTIGCKLSGEEPFRVVARASGTDSGLPIPYSLSVRNLFSTHDCQTVPAGTDTSAPTPSTAPCKLFIAPAAGRYDFYEVGAGGTRQRVPGYNTAGVTSCGGTGSCFMAQTQRYTLVTEKDVLVVDSTAESGCRPATAGVQQGSISAPGAVDCLLLPADVLPRPAVFTTESGGGLRPEIALHDATDRVVCDATALSWGTCRPNGTFPYRLLVKARDQQATGSYGIAVHATHADQNCRQTPAGDFTAATATTTLRTGGDVFSHCLSIPAADHSLAENLQLRRVSGTADARAMVLTTTGERVCVASTTHSAPTTCSLSADMGYNVFFVGGDTSAEYTLTRRDVTSTAQGCTSTPATPVGGPAAGGLLGAPGTLLCRQVTTGDAEDTLHLNVRDAAGSAHLLAHDDQGRITTCSFRDTSCAVRGSKTYQVLVSVPDGGPSADAFAFDALRIGTKSGPAAECARVPNVSYGAGPFTGTLDAGKTAACAVLPTARDARFDAEISDSAGGTGTAVPALYNTRRVNGCVPSDTGYTCAVGAFPADDGTSTLVLGLPDKSPRTSYRAQLACVITVCGLEAHHAASVSPMTVSNGGVRTFTVTGTSLHEGDSIELTRRDHPTPVVSTFVAVSADRGKLTVELDLTRVPSGAWNMKVSPYSGGPSFPMSDLTITQATAAPVNITPPSIVAPLWAGRTARVYTGGWSSPQPTEFTHQWKEGGRPIPGATGSTYEVPESMLGRDLTVTVTARRDGGIPTTLTTAPVTVTSAVALQPTTAPAINWTPRVGEPVSALPGVWSPANPAFTYQWNLDGVPIPGATATMHYIPAAQLGRKLTVTVTARLSPYIDGVATSAPVTVVKGAAPAPHIAPKINGSVRAGVKATVSPGAWTPDAGSYAYQWKANGSAIPGATAAAYTVSGAYTGKKLTVTVTARLTGHADGTATTAPVTVAKGAAPKATKAPAISGTAKVNRKLTLARGTWSPAPTSYTCQWYADGVAISRATGTSLTLKSAQVGKKITVKVTAKRTGHSDGSSLTRPTARVVR